MENNNNTEQVVANISKDGYYTSRSLKFVDFIVGFIGTIIVIYLFLVSSSFNSPISLVVVAIILVVILPAIFFKIGRKFIAIGMFSVGIAGLILFGSCILMLSGLNF